MMAAGAEGFLDWWFNPWLLGRGATSAPAGGTLSARLDYRFWCGESGIRPDLPDAGDTAWQQFALCDTARLSSTAHLYGALLAAREGRHGDLASLSSDERRWSLGTAAIQPLARLCPASGDLLSDGLRELACALESGFAGMWDRLRLLLPGEQADDAGAALTGFILNGQLHGAASGAAARRRLRCWGLCLARTANAAFAGDPA